MSNELDETASSISIEGHAYGSRCEQIIQILDNSFRFSTVRGPEDAKVHTVPDEIQRLDIGAAEGYTEKIDDLTILKRLETLCHESCQCLVANTPDIEKKIFRNENYIENNAFSTTHQNVNVYGTPEMKYEIRNWYSGQDYCSETRWKNCAEPG